MVDLMQEVEFVKVGTDSKTGEKLLMMKDGNGETFTESQLKEMFRKNTKELTKEEKTKKKKKEIVEDVIIEETNQTD